MIKKHYDDGKKHVHVLSLGAGTQSSALLIKALKDGINGVKPDYIIFSDTGWEPNYVYEWLGKLNEFAKRYDREVVIARNGNIREDMIKAAEKGERLASLPFFTKDPKTGKKGMTMRQCTSEYKIVPIKRKIRELLGYKKGQVVKEMVHVWKGISTDEIQRVKPIKDRWQTAEHPLIEELNWDRSKCIAYVEQQGLGTPAQSSCIGCPFHSDALWLDIKRNDPKSWEDAVYIDKKIRHLPGLKGEVYLHRSCQPLDEVDLQEDQLMLNLFGEECEGMCGV